MPDFELELTGLGVGGGAPVTRVSNKTRQIIICSKYLDLILSATIYVSRRNAGHF